PTCACVRLTPRTSRGRGPTSTRTTSGCATWSRSTSTEGTERPAPGRAPRRRPRPRLDLDPFDLDLVGASAPRDPRQRFLPVGDEPDVRTAVALAHVRPPALAADLGVDPDDHEPQPVVHEPLHDR